MANKIATYINDKEDAFVLVGLAHLIGKQNIIQLLQEKGYVVNQIQYSTNNEQLVDENPIR